MSVLIGMELALALTVGLVAGWLAWMMVGERGMGIAVYLLFGIAGGLLGILLARYLGTPVEGVLGSALIAPVGALMTLSLITYVDRRVS